MTDQPVDLSAPAYQRGQSWANAMLDASILTAHDMLDAAEQAADIAHQRMNTEAYLLARGFGDTIRDYLADRSD